MPEPAPEPPGLRERRRRQTERDLNEAALDLFEAQGVDHTTAEQIARRAGTSPRTFFRYFPTKESAALLGNADLEQRVGAMVAAVRADRPLLPQLELIWREVLRAIAADGGEDGPRLLRVRRLMQAEPALRLAGLRLDEERVEQLVDRLGELTDRRPDDVRLVVELGAAVVRHALDQWAAAAERGHVVDLLATYEAAVRTVRAEVAADQGAAQRP